MSVLSFALELASQKVRLFPVCPNSKVPSITDFPKKASSDPLQLEKFFATQPNLNSGIACGFVSDGLYLVGFDIDAKGSKNGFQTLADLEKMGKHFPPTWSQKTPTGGEHRLYWSPKPIRQGVDICGPGIDLRSDGGYLVGPGSSLNGRLYEPITTGSIVQFPAWAVVDFEKKARIIELVSKKHLPAKDQVLALKRAVEYLASLEPTTEGARNDIGYKVICRLKDFGVAQNQLLDVMLEHWRCHPMLEIDELTQLVNSSFRYGGSPGGISSPDTVFPDAPAVADSTPLVEPHPKRDVIGELNSNHLVVNENGKSLIYREGRDEALRRNVLQRFSFEDFKKLYANRFVEKDGKIIPAPQAWISSPKRREYIDGTTFDPTGTCSKGYYNLWQGWAIEPAEGEFPQIDRFLREVICSNDDELYHYLIGWLARMFQHPEKTGEVALVFKGLKGTGKSTLAEFLLDIMGQHGMEISQPGQLTGRFLSHLRDAVFVVANESFWSGDRQAEGQLKSIITNKYLSLEGKFQAPITVKNVVHLMFTTNDNWAVPASMGDERRFAIFEVSKAHMQNRKYFGALREEAYNRGGLAAMLHFFLNYDISDYDPTEIPQNAALSDQKIRSLRGPDKWLFEALSMGVLAGYAWGDEALELPKTTLYNDYVAWNPEFRPEPSGQWAKSIWKYLGDTATTFQPHGETRKFRFGPLTRSRDEFIKRSGLVGVDWGDDGPQDSFEDLL